MNKWSIVIIYQTLVNSTLHSFSSIPSDNPKHKVQFFSLAATSFGQQLSHHVRVKNAQNYSAQI